MVQTVCAIELHMIATTNRLSQPERPEKERHPVWRLVRFLGLVTGLGFLCWMVWRLSRNPAVAFDRISVLGFVAALVIGVIANALIGLLFGELIGKLAPNIPPRRRIASYYLSQLAKYIPGRVAAILVQSATLNTPGAMAVSLITNVELMVITGLLCTAAAVVCLTIGGNLFIALSAGLLGIFAGAWLVRLDWHPLLQWGLRLIRSPSATRSLHTKVRPSRSRAFLLSACVLLLPAASIYTLLAAGFSMDFDRSLSLTSALLLSWVGGMLAFIFPAGIGIRELLFIGVGHSLTQAAAPEQMVAIALMSRLVQVLTDVVGTCTFALFDLVQKRAAVRHGIR